MFWLVFDLFMDKTETIQFCITEQKELLVSWKLQDPLICCLFQFRNFKLKLYDWNVLLSDWFAHFGGYVWTDWKMIMKALFIKNHSKPKMINSHTHTRAYNHRHIGTGKCEYSLGDEYAIKTIKQGIKKN